MKNSKLFNYAELKCSKGRYYVYFSVFDPITEKLEPQRIYIKKYSSVSLIKREGKRVVGEINNKLETGWNPLTEGASFKPYTLVNDALKKVDSVIGTYQNQKTKNTMLKRIDDLRKYIAANNLASIWISRIDGGIANDFMDTITQKKNKKGAYISNRTFNNHLSDYRLVFNLLQKRGFVKENCFNAVDFKVEKEADIVPFTKHEQSQYANYLLQNDKSFFCISGMVYYCALRPVEITRLLVGDVNLREGFIKITGSQSKNSRTRFIPIAHSFKPHLKEYLKGYKPESYFVSKNFEPGPDYLWPSRISERFAQIRDELGFHKKLYFYSLKHTTADRLISGNFDLRTLQELFRHSTLQETDVYSRKIKPFFDENLVKNFPKFE